MLVGLVKELSQNNGFGEELVDLGNRVLSRAKMGEHILYFLAIPLWSLDKEKEKTIYWFFALFDSNVSDYTNFEGRK